MSEYDVAVIGAGPAGLAAVQNLDKFECSVLLIDQGRSIFERDKDLESELTQGHGGAGLYSDGKFSFFPSASNLWNLPRSKDLRAAYDWTCNLLKSYGLDTPPYPSNPEDYAVGAGEWVLKAYPSDYLSLQARIELIGQLVSHLSADIATETQVHSYLYNKDDDRFELILEGASNERYTVKAKRLIIASGRFGPLWKALDVPRSFQRLEVGFRIEQPHERSFFNGMTQLDPKLKLQSEDGNVEWRTFCACRNGETVFTETQQLWTVSGHSDGPASGKSNVGFNTRILDEKLAINAIESVIVAMRDKHSYFRVSLQDALQGNTDAIDALDKVYGKKLREIMLLGVQKLIGKFPSIDHSQTRLIGPTLEGVGWYPCVDGNLRMPDIPAWVAGDACGLFRGIVAAFISGHYAADSVINELVSKGRA
ncbi:FAD-dependent oxidoreductase [Pectobacterium zantedeschiae]|uniref:FAD/NAD(P)-binding domain-containing protein n=1 Tax=Pectobacterium zantedeschiae TaxID=2034769 RepID=A0A9X8P548_9GAMM|nr:FAD-dependent oxidoreductase [Pectobacterium zantedeschiae]RYC44064.1 hypothetical protein CLR69_03195 [Pectobacterium zantedeschiae]RYC48716.1 hypothetical protein CTN06_04430 [Pectobacterium zantedeschiae]